MTATDTPAPTRRRAPRPHRLAFFVVMAVYPIVTALIYGMAPLTETWQIWQRNLIMVPIVVVCMVWVIIPRINRHLHHLL